MIASFAAMWHNLNAKSEWLRVKKSTANIAIILPTRQAVLLQAVLHATNHSKKNQKPPEPWDRISYLPLSKRCRHVAENIIPCSVDSAEFPYITLKCKLKN